MAKLQPIQSPQRKIPIDQIIAVQGQNPIAQGIEAGGNVIGQAIAKRAQLQQQGQQLAALAKVAGQDPSAYAGLAPESANAIALKQVSSNIDVKEEARKQALGMQKARSLEAQFGYKPNELGDDYDTAKLKVQADLSEQRANSGSSAENRKQRAEIAEKNRYRNYLLDIEQKDPIIKKINENGLNMASIDALQSLVKDGNTVAFSGLGIKMAKGMGEVGVMTENDVKRYVQSRQISQKAADTLLGWLRGSPTEATMNELGDIQKAMRSAFQENLQPRIDQYIRPYSKIEGLAPEDFADRLGMSYGGKLRALETPALKPMPGATQKPLTAINPKTGQRIMSTDGGQTWQPAR